MLKSLDALFISRSVYGLVNVLVILLIMEDHPPTALEGAVTLFGAAFAIALVEAYAELVGETIGHQRGLTADEWRHIVRAVSPVLIGALAPTLVMLLAALGLYTVDTGISISQALVFILLAILGVRAIVYQHRAPLMRILGGATLLILFVLMLGLKVAFH